MGYLSGLCHWIIVNRLLRYNDASLISCSGCVASIMRLDASVVFLQSPDFTFQVASVGLWA